MTKPAWSWADYERCKRAEERRRARAGAIEIESVEAQEVPTADDASGCKGRAPEGSIGPAPVGGQLAPVSPSHVAVKARQSRIEQQARTLPGKIDITAAPSGMEAAASRWEGKGITPGRLAQSVPVLCEGKVMCRCGAQGPGQTRGPVPVWFGDKCIEAKCELRASSSAAVGAERMRGSPRG